MHRVAYERGRVSNVLVSLLLIGPFLDSDTDNAHYVPDKGNSLITIAEWRMFITDECFRLLEKASSWKNSSEICHVVTYFREIQNEEMNEMIELIKIPRKNHCDSPIKTGPKFYGPNYRQTTNLYTCSSLHDVCSQQTSVVTGRLNVEMDWCGWQWEKTPQNDFIPWKLFFLLLAFRERNPLVTGGFLSQWPVILNFDVCFPDQAFERDFRPHDTH